MYCCESSQALPVRPVVKTDWRKGRALESEESKVGNGRKAVCSRGGRLSNWAEFFNVIVGWTECKVAERS